MAIDAQSSETIVALVPRANLAGVLSAMHGAGLGRQLSVIDPVRGDVEGRLGRLGIAGASNLLPADVDAVLVVAPAPGRIVQTEALLLERGAIGVERHGRLPAREHDWFASLFGGAEGSPTPAG